MRLEGKAHVLDLLAMCMNPNGDVPQTCGWPDELVRDLTRSAEARKRACDVTDDLRRMAKPCQ